MSQKLKVRFFASVVVFFSIAGCGSNFIEQPASQAGIQAAEPIIKSLRTYRHQHGFYPDSLAALNLPEAVGAGARHYDFSYFRYNEGAGYTIAFDPSGPARSCVYGEGISGQGVPRWSCLLK